VLRQGLKSPYVNVRKGLLSQYARGPTDAQIWYHETVTGLLSDYDDYDGMIAVLNCELVGRDAWIKIEDSPWLHVFVGDCSGHSSTTNWMRRANILFEMDWYLKERFGVPDLKAVPGEIAWQNPLPWQPRPTRYDNPPVQPRWLKTPDDCLACA
jgi:hypothetical protein